MLGIGHYYFNTGQNAITSHHPPLLDGFQSSCLQTALPQPGQHQTSVPLTPPGSPEDAPLVICESPQKTPSKERSATAVDASINGNFSSGRGIISTSNFDQLAYAGPFDSISATPVDLTPNLDASVLSNVRPSSIFSTVSSARRPRNEKKSMPDLMKDEKYFERRRRNNAAAKKSRDNRKSREEEISARVAFLEKENAILRVQAATLREEAQNLRVLLMQKRERDLSAQSFTQVSQYGAV